MIFLSEAFNDNSSSDRKKVTNSSKNTLMSSDNSFLLKLSPFKFYYKRYGNDRTWYTCYGRNRLQGIHHTFMDLSDSQQRIVQKFLNIEMYQVGVRRVDCPYQVRALEENALSPSHNDTKTKFTFRCNPTYRKKPWYDWVMVDYMKGSEMFSIPSRLLMLLSHSSPIDESNNSSLCLYALVHSLQHVTTSPYADLNVFKSDIIYHEPKVVDFNDSISGTAFVLPGIDRNSTVSSLHKDVCSNQYYVVVPKREDWCDLWW